MNLIKRTIHWGLRNYFFFYTYLKWRIYGIESVSERLSNCPRLYVKELLVRYGAKIGKEVTFKNNIFIDNPIKGPRISKPYANIEVGDGSYIGKMVYFDLFAKINIGEKCAVSSGVKFVTHMGVDDEILAGFYPRREEDIFIGEGTWVGTNVVILCGIVLGKRCVVGAGAVVTQSFPAYSVIGGVPARLIKTLEAP